MYASFSLARPSATIRRKRSRTCLRRRARHAKKPGAVSARACCTIFLDYAFLHESRNKVKQNFSVAEFLLAYAYLAMALDHAVIRKVFSRPLVYPDLGLL